MPPTTSNKYPPKELTYLALEDTLKDKTSKDVGRKDLLLIVGEHEDEFVQALVRAYNHKSVVGGARELLLAEVFKHPANAEKELSSILYFTDSESESGEGRADASAGGKAARDRPRPRRPGTLEERVAASAENYAQNQWRHEPLLHQLARVRRKKEWKGRPIPDYDNKDPLSPRQVALPMNIQHLLLSNLIQVLENSCYSYAVIHAPGIVAHRRYDYREGSELRKWTTDFSEKKTFRCDDKELAAHRESLLNEVAKMRHSIVNREPVGVDTMARYFCNAEELTMLMGDTEARGLICGTWQAIGEVAFGLMQDTMAKVQAHTTTMDPIRVQKDALDAQKQDGLTGYQQTALAAKREAVLAAENELIEKAQRDYRELSQAAGRAIQDAMSARGIILGTLGIWMPPQNAPTIAEGPHEGEMPSIKADVSQFASLLAEVTEKNDRGSNKEEEGAHAGQTSDQPPESTAEVQGKRKEEEPHEKKMKMREQKNDVHERDQPPKSTADAQRKRKEGEPHEKKMKMREQKKDVHEGGISIRGQGESSARGNASLLSKETWRSRSRGISMGGQGESSATGKVSPLSKESWRYGWGGRDPGYEAGQGGAPVERHAFLSSKKAQVVPEQWGSLFSANESQNARDSYTKRKWAALEADPWARPGKDMGYEAGQGGAPVERHALLSSKKAQVVPEQGWPLFSANGSENARDSDRKLASWQANPWANPWARPGQ